MALTSKTGPLPPKHHRKRSGGHHRKQSKHYSKTYWPYLPMLGIAGIGLMLNLIWPGPTSQVLSFATNTSITGLLNETNSQRQTASQAPLRTNAQLTAAAQAKANDMATRNYWSHVTPDGHQPWWFVTNAGYEYQSTGENLAYGFATSQATVTGWMNSAGHRANILNATYQDVGFGIANAENYQSDGQQTIVVALYGRPLKQPVAAAPSPAPAATAKPSSAKAVSPPAPVSAASQNPASGHPAAQPPTTTPPAAPTTIPTKVAAEHTNQNAVLSSEESSRQLASITPSHSVARLEALSTLSPWAMMAVVALGAVAATVFVMRHGIMLHRMLNRGEKFISRHWKLDVGLVAVLAVVVLLTRTAGFIQ